MNKKVVFRIFVAVVVYIIIAFIVSSYVDDSPQNMRWEDRETFNRQFIANLKVDHFTFEQSLDVLGNPDVTEAKKVGKDRYQVLFYRTHHVKSDGITTQDECTALLFKNDDLYGIGPTAYKEFQSLIPQLPQ